MSSPFIHLRVHSEYSLCDGLLRINKLIDGVRQHGMPAVALTDHANLFALVKFYRKALAAGIKPIVGADLWLQDQQECFAFTVLCQNQTGYQHLTRLISQGYINGQTAAGLPTVRWEWIAQYAEGLLILSGGCQGDVGQALLAGNNDLAKNRLLRWKQLFDDRYYLELTRTKRGQESNYIKGAVKLASDHQVPVVATNDVRFLKQEDFEAHEARVCIHSGYVLADGNRPRRYSDEQYLKNSEAMHEQFRDIPEAITNSVAIAKRCNLQLSLGKPYLPQFPLPDNVSLEDYIQKHTEAGLQARLQQTQLLTEENLNNYRQRLHTELNVINRMGFPGYFLIVADFISWAKQHDIPVGPGRGSGAGSLVAYVLGITELDPIQHELLFERFLNPERVSMPDFDIDFCMEGRDRVIEYVAEHYGREAVSQIITFGTMAAKAVVRDVGRVLGLPYGFCDKIAKLIPFELGMTLDKALQQEAQLAVRYKQEEEVTILIDLARKLEGIARNAGKHAGGVVIAPTRLTDFAPLYCEPGGVNLVTQFDKDDVEAVGLVKFDFLGLRTLTIIHWALQAVNQTRAKLEETPIAIGQIPLNDAKTFKLLQSCQTTAVFQLESRGMKDLIRRLKPDSFDEITALVALFRPGPLQSGMVDDFIDRKHGRAPVYYPHPDVETILKPTYGVILYQEQVMQIAQVLAGYSLGGADILRRAMGKKKPEEMAKQRVVFIKGASERGIESSIAEHIFDLMEKFAGYGFNKSHSAAYALIAYQTAWLKAHYPAEFMAAVLSSDMDNTDKVVLFLQEAASMNLTILPPNINLGEYAFSVNDAGHIEYGLGAIKGVGESAVVCLVEERKANGAYQDLFDCCQRLESRKITRRVLEPLVASGAMDVFKESRAVLMASIDKALKTADQRHFNESIGQADMFGMESASEPLYVQVAPWLTAKCLEREKEALGFYLSGHPLESYEQEIAMFASNNIAGLMRQPRKQATIAGYIVNMRAITTKSGRRMAVLTLEDRSGRIEVTMFSKLYDALQGQLNKEEVFVVTGKVEDDNFTGGVRIVAEQVESLAAMRANRVAGLTIAVRSQKEVDQLLKNLPNIIKPYCGGGCKINIAYQGASAKALLQLGSAWQVHFDNELFLALRELYGEDQVTMHYGHL